MKNEAALALPVRAELRAAKWTGARTFTIKLWAYFLPEASKSATTQLEVWLQDDEGRRSHALVRKYAEPLSNERSLNPVLDTSTCAFEAVFDFEGHLPDATAQGTVVTAYVAISDGSQRQESTLTHRYRWGSAGALDACGHSNGVQVVPSWTENGLEFKIARRIALAHAASFAGDELRLWIKSNGRFAPDVAILKDDAEREVRASFFNREGTWVEIAFNVADLPDLGPNTRESWRVYLFSGETSRLVHWSNVSMEHSQREDGLRLTSGPSGVMRLDRLQHNLEANVVDFYALPIPHLTISGSYWGEKSRPTALCLEGARSSVSAELVTSAGGQFVFSIPLTSHSGTGPISVASGGYRVGVYFGDESYDRLRPAKALVGELYKAHYSEDLNIRLERSPGNELYINVSPPMAPSELGEYNQRKLRASIRKAAEPLNDCFYFESWFGKNFSDSPLALFHAAKRRLPAAQLFVSVADLSVPLPEGATPVVRNSAKSWKALAKSKYVITNCWAPSEFERHPDQVFVQTWHGTPLKLLGLDRPGSRDKPSRVAKIEREANDWSLLISQNPHSTEVFRRAYGYAGEILESGYPRNDALFDADVLGGQVREALKIAPGKTVVLYAPTWREDKTATPDLIQAGEMAKELGPDFVVLLRGHSVSLRRGQNVEAVGVIDVTSFNDTSGLMAAADVLVTDYSSIMFDFSVTEKPVIFFVPDWDVYTGSGRGVYFDLSVKAPGPLCHTRDTVIEALRDLSGCRRLHKEAYVAWRKEFNPWDNPNSSETVFSRLLELGHNHAKS
ncbi:CDP-glycerol glycerophosphotransferase family protein [Arthrobacter sp. EPSL27]|uniref:CDP-glycerol glycerophosphotransferase family protein n=1 Tax=Arthrobacter sp. EPSL27 TaxID=1745378 RepID=UPI0009E740E0|nr:CDP-glycerol glycerophosphotransferase family protein [Arthrobacter sp. EPSL27]